MGTNFASMTRHVVARPDPALSARVTRTSLLRYAGGAQPALDQPAHVRAGSGIAWVGGHLVVVQDDANFIALVDPRDGTATAIPLPAGEGGRRQFDDASGNKAHKLDLEAVANVTLPDGAPMVLALGSGSTARREIIVTVRGLDARSTASGEAIVATHAVPAFYARLRALVAFAGSELNVEAAAFLADERGGRLRLFNRGNGAPRHGLDPVNATCEVDWRALAAHLAHGDVAAPPAPSAVVQYDLGEIAGRPLGFTDAAVVDAPAAGRRLTVYTVAAEDSPDATRDGPVAGCAVGVIAEGREGIRARWTPLRAADGRPFEGKVEGIALRPGDPTRALVVIDRDAHLAPSDLCEVVLDGPWLAER